MKRFSMLLLLAAAIYALTGCILTDYPCITDTENPDYLSCDQVDGRTDELHNTNGWAHVLEGNGEDGEEARSATDQNMDGTYTYVNWFVSQDSAGTQMIANVAETSATIDDEADFPHHSDLYAQGGQKDLDVFAYAIYLNSTYNPDDHTGEGDPPDPLPVIGDFGDITGNCAPDEPAGGEGGGSGSVYDPFPYDYLLTTSCPLATFDISMMEAYDYRLGEAGRAEGSSAGMPLGMKLGMLQSATATPDGLSLTFDASDWMVEVSQGSYSRTLDLSALHGLTIDYDPSNPGHVGNAIAREIGLTPEKYLAVASQFSGIHRGVEMTMTVTAFGETWEFRKALAHVWDAELTAASLGTYGTSGGSTGTRRR